MVTLGGDIWERWGGYSVTLGGIFSNIKNPKNGPNP